MSAHVQSCGDEDIPESIGVTFSKKKWRQIFREVDHNGDNSVSVDEMIKFLFEKAREPEVINPTLLNREVRCRH